MREEKKERQPRGEISRVELGWPGGALTPTESHPQPRLVASASPPSQHPQLCPEPGDRLPHSPSHFLPGVPKPAPVRVGHPQYVPTGGSMNRLKNTSICYAVFFLKDKVFNFFLMFILREHEWGRGRERGRHRI